MRKRAGREAQGNRQRKSRQADEGMPSHSFKETADIMRKPYEPFWFSTVFLRWWTIYLSAVLVKLRLSANAVTAISAVSIVVGSALVLSDQPSHWLWAAFLLWFYYVLDHCDGEVARYYISTGELTPSPAGSFWDGVAHGFEVVPIGTVAFALYLQGLGYWPLVLALITFTRFAIAPWQRYCEILIEWGKKQSPTDNPVSFQFETWVTDSADEEPDESAAQVGRPWGRWIRQCLAYPGIWTTLPLSLALDALVGPLPISLGSVPIPWSALWLLQITVVRSLGGLKNTFLYGRQLKRLGQ